MAARVIVTVLLFAFAAGLSAAFAWYASHGLFARHQGRHADLPMDDRPRRELAAIAPAPDTTAEFESMGRLRGTAGQRAGYWPMDATSPGTELVDYHAAWDERPYVPPPPCGCGAWHDPRIACLPEHMRQPAQVEVTDDPPRGKHEKPRAYLVHAGPETYCSTCGSGEHWTDKHTGPDPLVTQMVADRAESRARHAIDDDLRAAGFKVYPGGEDDAVKSMWTRASGLELGAAIAAVEAARKP